MMMIDEETTRGVEYLKGIFESGRILRLGEPQELYGSHSSYHFKVRAFEKEWGFSLSWENLSDLPRTKTYRDGALELARGLEKRFRNVSPLLFQSCAGRVLKIDVQWPYESLPQQASSCLRVNVWDHLSGEFINCYVIITHQQSLFDLKENPFRVHQALINSIREAVDTRNITFYPSQKDHPHELQPVRLSFAASRRKIDITDFLRKKASLMGFRSGTSQTQLWVGDPWDATYLDVSVRDLRQEAEILDAEGYLQLDSTREFATAGKELILSARRPNYPVATSSTVSHAKDYDVFLSHASEDKPFVRELAAALKARGIKYWLDEIELTVGDSLRTMIDKGLTASRFGVVVLSHPFFAKHWPQRELDGLLSLEIDRKVILPVWHDITSNEVSQYSPTLAGRLAALSSEGAEVVAEKLAKAIHK
jgi:hypothetical protein